ncbi:unnamed protein product [Lactuca virosa]|uniref:Uncharacterized protein n=1 Tax=Lactuca virosa TaxID=75947 RepID=A0AAU9MN83_9ASTR|nr:unnamed protein product [Lactuca virosa]
MKHVKSEEGEMLSKPFLEVYKHILLVIGKTMKHVKSEEGEMLSKRFLEVCKHILLVINNSGAAMTLVKIDVGCNITVAIKLAPDRKKFMDVVGGKGDINSDIENFCATFTPLLEENHKFLYAGYSVGLDDMKEK